MTGHDECVHCGILRHSHYLNDAIALLLADMIKDENTPQWIRIRACDIAALAYGIERSKR